jgi:hypothetical protein
LFHPKFVKAYKLDNPELPLFNREFVKAYRTCNRDLYPKDDETKQHAENHGSW